MPAISTTTLEQLEPLLVAQISATVPRVVVRGSSAWKHYVRGRATAARMRNFTVRWVPGVFETGGYFGGFGVEHAAQLLVRTDYAGSHETLQWVVQDDYVQLRDRLNLLTADITTGLISILPVPGGPSLVADTAQGRQRLSDRPASNADTFQIDHAYALTYMQARAAA